MSKASKSETPIRSKLAYRYFNWMYIIALSVIGTITVISYVNIERSLQNQLADTHIVNIAGRQRMLSQKISKVVLQLKEYNDDTSLLNELEWAIILFNEQHKLVMESIPNNKYKEDIQQLSLLQKDISNASYSILQNVDFNTNAQLILSKEKSFLKLMDALVYNLDNDSSLRMKHSQKITLWFSGGILGSILMIGVTIFFPMYRRIKKNVEKIIESEKKSQKAAQELKTANKSLEKINKEVKDINFALDAASILIKTDAEGIITYANNKYSDITKYTQEELIGKKLFENLITGEESIVYQFINSKEKNKLEWHSEVHDHAKDGSYFWLDTTLIPIRSEDGKLYQYLVICSEITKRKIAEEELARLNQEKLTQQIEEQRITSNAIISGQEKERKRMSFEIHDGVGQLLTGLKFITESISPANKKQEYSIEQAKIQLQQIIREIRRISSDLLPTELEDFGLESAIKGFVKNLKHDANLEVLLNGDLNLEHRLDKSIEINIYRVIQEAVNNAIKHSEAKRIVVTLESDAEFLTFTVQDNGKGFNYKEKIQTRGQRDKGNGLANMIERIELIGGKMLINSSLNKGTTILIEIPLNKYSYGKN